MFEASQLKPDQIAILKTIKFNESARRRLNAQAYGIVNQIFFDQFYEREVKQFKATIQSAKTMPSAVLSKAFLLEYNISGKESLTDERIEVIAKDQADATIDLMTRQFLLRDFTRHLTMAISHNLSHEATTKYLESMLGLKIESKAQCEAIQSYYDTLTETLTPSVGF